MSEKYIVTWDMLQIHARKLAKAANVIGPQIEYAKVFLSGELTRAVTVRGLRVTKGARAVIEAAGGKIEE